MRASKETWKLDEPSYSRTWTEIEEMLHSAVNEMNAQRAKFHLRKVTGPREAKYRALMKYQRAKGNRRHTSMDYWRTGSKISS